MYYLGLDIGSSSVKAGLVDASNGKSIHSVHEPKNEMGIISKKMSGQSKTQTIGGYIHVRLLKEFVMNQIQILKNNFYRDFLSNAWVGSC